MIIVNNVVNYSINPYAVSYQNRVDIKMNWRWLAVDFLFPSKSSDGDAIVFSKMPTIEKRFMRACLFLFRKHLKPTALTAANVVVE